MHYSPKVSIFPKKFRESTPFSLFPFDYTVPSCNLLSSLYKCMH